MLKGIKNKGRLICGEVNGITYTHEIFQQLLL